ncbi:hypothetical protein AMTRI_Chr03g141770 [Amborella trichopoda]
MKKVIVDCSTSDSEESFSASVVYNPNPNPNQVSENFEASTSDPRKSHFVDMGFSPELVDKLIKEHGDEDSDSLLETLLTYSAIQDTSPPREPFATNPSDSESDGTDLVSDLWEADSSENEESENPETDQDKLRRQLVDMGFPEDDVISAMDRCGPNASIPELADSIYAAQTAKAAGIEDSEALRLSGSESSYDDEFETEPSDYYSILPPSPENQNWGKRPFHEKKRKWDELSHGKKRRTKQPNSIERKKWVEKPIGTHKKEWEWTGEPNWIGSNWNNASVLRRAGVTEPKMLGFGIPSMPDIVTSRFIPETAMGPPYFYFENVAISKKGTWETFSRFLYDIEPEFVDSKYFSVARRKRGYIHNLPIEKRSPLLPIPPLTIQEALPFTKEWWPSWDTRTKLNCILGCTGSAQLTERIRKALVSCNGEPSFETQKYVMEQCKKWNLVWVGLNKVAPLEPDEIEPILGFPKYHTRGGGSSRTERLRALGNSFQVDTVAYHLSVLKPLFPSGLTVFSLFTGIGGAEVALYRLGIPFKAVVSVEISEVSRTIFRNWWAQTNQKGVLLEIEDVKQLTNDKLQHLVSSFGGFDLVIGGSPCNNLSGCNRVTRDGLEGKHSSLFFDYFRILDVIKCIMAKRR